MFSCGREIHTSFSLPKPLVNALFNFVEILEQFPSNSMCTGSTYMNKHITPTVVGVYRDWPGSSASIIYVAHYMYIKRKEEERNEQTPTIYNNLKGLYVSVA